MNARLIKQKPIHIHKEFPAHEWKLDEYGDIDEFAMSYDFHNGPVCKNCGYSFCEFCYPDGWKDKSCIIDEDRCPNCNHLVIHLNNYCSICGQALDWEKDNG